MNSLDYLPTGAVIVSAKSGSALMRACDGWLRADLDSRAAVIPVAHDLFAEAEKAVT